MQDLIQGQQPERRSVRNISIDRPASPSGDDPTVPPSASSESIFKEPGGPSFSSRPRFIGSRGSSKKLWWIVGGVVVTLILLFVVGSLFAGATVTLTPKQALVNLDTTFTAYQTPAPGQVGFETITVEKEAGRSVTATGEENIDRPASGRIIIYNNFDENPLKLIKNTRFETPDGKIYRVQESVTVPGKQGDTPGSIEAMVFADSAGEEYNIGLTDFTVPGFKEQNDPLFDAVYARSKTEMTGGFSGIVKIASDADTEAAQNEMEAELTTALLDEARATLPPNFVLLPESAEYFFEPLPNTEGADGQVTLRSRGTVRLMALDKDIIASAAAAERISGYTGEPVTFADTEGLTLQIVTSPFDLSTASSTDVRVTGPTTLLWTFDTDAIAEELRGVSRGKTGSVFSKYPGIEKADVVVRPFWKRSLPDESGDITIVVIPAKQ